MNNDQEVNWLEKMNKLIEMVPEEYRGCKPDAAYVDVALDRLKTVIFNIVNLANCGKSYTLLQHTEQRNFTRNQTSCVSNTPWQLGSELQHYVGVQVAENLWRCRVVRCTKFTSKFKSRHGDYMESIDQYNILLDMIEKIPERQKHESTVHNR